MVGLLFSFALVFLVLAGLFITMLRIRGNEDETLTFPEAFWQSLMRAMDPGAIGGDAGWPLRMTSLVITIMGIFVISALIGILASGLDTRLAALQRGRGKIAVAGHTLVLGWSPKVMTLLAQLAIAKQEEHKPTVVILANRNKTEMDDVIASRLDEDAHRHLRVVTRSGAPQELTDLDLVNPDLATSIIVVSDDESANDSGVIKAVLALVSHERIDSSTPVVAEIHSSARAQALRSVTGAQVAVVEPGEIISRAAAQSSRETGLSLVLEELFDFGGSEIYFADLPQAHGLSFGEVLNCLERSCVIGLVGADGEVRVNPAMDSTVTPQDRLILIAEDNSTIAWTGARDARANTASVVRSAADKRAPETLIIVGWNAYGTAIVGHLDDFVSENSHMTIVVDPELVPGTDVRPPEDLRHLTVTVRELPDTPDPVGTVLGDTPCDHILILCYRDADISVEEAQSRVLTTFLEVRNTLQTQQLTANVTAELLDERDVALIPSANAAEFMVSEKLASLMMSQLAENIGLQAVFTDLLDAQGSEIYCKPVAAYCQPGVPTRFADLVETAREYGEVAIGWRVDSLRSDATSGFGVRVNPAKSEVVTFMPGDQLVVIAQDDA